MFKCLINLQSYGPVNQEARILLKSICVVYFFFVFAVGKCIVRESNCPIRAEYVNNVLNTKHTCKLQDCERQELSPTLWKNWQNKIFAVDVDAFLGCQ